MQIRYFRHRLGEIKAVINLHFFGFLTDNKMTSSSDTLNRLEYSLNSCGLKPLAFWARNSPLQQSDFKISILKWTPVFIAFSNSRDFFET